jgi:hypothetical protein
MDKTGGLFLDATSTEDDEHFVVLVLHQDKVYFQLYSFVTGSKIPRAMLEKLPPIPSWLSTAGTNCMETTVTELPMTREGIVNTLPW